MSLWCLMAAPLMITCDVRNMNEATKRILTNRDIIAIDQDPLGIQAERIINNDTWQVFVKQLANGDVALGVLNVSDKTQTINIDLAALGITGKSNATDLWSKAKTKVKNTIKVQAASHETKVYRLAK
jgi:alpha-galactosidase